MGRLKHGHSFVGSITSEYRSWSHMLGRCLNPSSRNYRYYGGRGIKVCERWRKFENFLADMGPKPTPKHSIDRFPDVNGNYEPSNCRWADSIQQKRNRRDSVILAAHGFVGSVGEWSERIGIKAKTIKARIANGWPITEALNPRLYGPYSHKLQKGDS